MTVSTTSGAKLYIGPQTAIDWTLSDPALLSLFEGIVWTEVGEIEDFGSHGDESAEVNFTSIGDSRVRKLKGPRNAGTLPIVAGRDPLDTGQAALVAAEKTKFNYPFKIVYADAPGEDYTDSVEYFEGLVMSRAVNMGTATDVTRRNFNIGINSEILEVLAEAASS